MEEFGEAGFLDALVSPGVIGAAIVVIGLTFVVLIVSRFLCICRPNELLVFSGKSHTLPDGTQVGYRVIQGGRAVRWPIIEEVNRMDTRVVPVMVEVNNAYSRGGIPLEVHAIANVKVTSDPRLVRNAIERLLTMSQRQIAGIAQQTLEGVLREVVAELTPEEVNEDRLKFADTLMRNAKDDFDKLGLALDVLKIQSVADEQGYLKNLGRAQIARMIRDAENAENQSQQVIAEATAEARQRAEAAKRRAQANVLTKQNEYRAELAKLEAEAKAIENEAEVAKDTARAEAEQELQLLRGELEKLRLEVDVFIPAEAQRKASEAHARALAAPVLETGRASAEALTMVAREWQAASDVGRDLYVLQHLDELVRSAAARVAKSSVGEIAVVDGGTGESFASALAMHPAAVSEVLRETGRAIGIDIQRLVRGQKEGDQ